MTKPILYMQTDSRWKNMNYSAPGEKKTIGTSGCGVTVAAMIIASIADKNVTPITTSKWSMANGYKALNQGTYYTYFVPQMKLYGIECKQLNKSNLYGTTYSSAHAEALNELSKGNWIIACMGKGIWTSSGHFVLVYGCENGYVYINDPASTASTRVKNTWSLFSKQVKYMWSVKVPSTISVNTNDEKKEELSTTYTTKQFVKDCQKIMGVTVDGVAGTNTLNKTVTISSKKNTSHALVKPIQKRLNSLGYNCGSEDGKAGSLFDSAVKNFQRQWTNNPDGEITAGGKTWKKLLGML